ncbi:MAG: hypothetical protein DRO12_04600 [Thermoprotei archaeon]|nr:MAG: hypothetical protein DRO12_04600 [Thermoprotei archaeon]
MKRFLGSIGEELAENTIKGLEKLREQVNVLEQELKELNRVESRLAMEVGRCLERIARRVSWKCLDPSFISVKLASALPRGVCIDYQVDKWGFVKILLFLKALALLLEQGSGRLLQPGVSHADKLILTRSSWKRPCRYLEEALNRVLPTAVVVSSDNRSHILWFEKPIPGISFVPFMAIARGFIHIRKTTDRSSVDLVNSGRSLTLWRVIRTGSFYRAIPVSTPHLEYILHVTRSPSEAERCKEELMNIPAKRYRVTILNDRMLSNLQRLILLSKELERDLVL